MRGVVVFLAAALAILVLNFVKPMNPGALVTAGRLQIPSSWDLTGPKTALAVVTPPEPQWLRVTSFNVYEGTYWVRKGGDFAGAFVGGRTYTVRVTPYAVMLYPAFPVPQPSPGTVPKVEGGQRSGDTFTFNGFQTQVIAVYQPPFPYSQPPGLNYLVSELAKEPKRWSTQRVQKLALEIYERFKYRTLGELLSYLTEWLQKNYRYALKYSGQPSNDMVDWFLFVSKTGMCVHFASAAAVLLNDMGIEARVVYGYAVSYVQGNYRVFVTPTHLWVEVKTPLGWVPWDPSPPMAVSYERQVRSATPVGGAPRPPAPPTTGGGRGAAAPNLSADPFLILLVLTTLALTLKYAIKLRDWPLIVRSCVERAYGVKGLTLREAARLSGIKELEEAQVRYLRKGRWGWKGFFKGMRFCVAVGVRTLFKRR